MRVKFQPCFQVLSLFLPCRLSRRQDRKRELKEPGKEVGDFFGQSEIL